MTLGYLGKTKDCFINTVVILTLKYIYGCATPKWLEILLQVIKYILTKNLNLKEHQKCIIGSKVMAMLMNWWILTRKESALAAFTAGMFKEITYPKLYY